MDTREAILTAKNVAANRNVTVTFSGRAEAFMTFTEDGAAITIPQADGLDRSVYRGYLDHECGHVLFTDRKVFKEYAANTSIKDVWNIYEDVHIENKMRSLYPGSRRNLDALQNSIFSPEWAKKIVFPLANNPRPSLMAAYTAWLLCVQRGLPYASIMEGGLAITPEMRRLATTHGSTSEECAKLAQEFIEEVMYNKAQKPRQTQQQQWDGAAQAPQGDAKSAPAPCQDQDSQSLQGDTQSKEEAKARKDFEKYQKKNDDPAKSFSAALAAASNMQNSVDPTASIKNANNPAGQNTARSEVYENVKGNRNFWKKITANPRLTAALYRQIAATLQSKQWRPAVEGQSGKLNPRRLARIATGDPRVFKTRALRLEQAAEVVVLVDQSSSMSAFIGEVHKIAAAINAALYRVGNIAVSMYAFSHLCIRMCNEKGKLEAPKVYGSTMLGNAMLKAVMAYSMKPDTRRICLILTDGDASDIDEMKQAIDLYKRLGIEIYGIGLNYSMLTKYIPETNCKILKGDYCPQLPKAMAELLIQGL